MENYGVGGTQVPFGDGIHVPAEGSETVPDSIDNTENYTQNVMKNIFLTCDTENTNCVPVLKLINFIRPFMQDHITELVQLQSALDPNNDDVSVDGDTFYKEMTLWASRISKLSFENVMEEKLTDSEIEQMDSKANNQSSISGSCGENPSKGYLELGLSNASNLSTSYGFDVSSQLDPILLQEQIREVDHQNRKLTNELEDVRILLTNSDDQIYNLQAEVVDFSRKLAAEQQLNDQLMKNGKFHEDLAESSIVAQKELVKLQKLLMSSSKEINHLEQNIQTLEGEKRQLENKVDQLKECEVGTKTSVMELQSEVNYKDQIIASLEESSMRLKTKLEEQQQILSHYTDVNEQLKLEKSKLEKNFRESLTRSALFNQTRSRSCSSYTDMTDSGILKHSKILNHRRFSVDNAHINTTPNFTKGSPRFFTDNAHINTTPNFFKGSPSFNSPTLLNMLQNPISPSIGLSAQHKKSSDSDDSFSSLTASNTSTPDKKHSKLVCDNIQCSPNERRLFSQYRFLGSAPNSKLVECSEVDVDSSSSYVKINKSPDINFNHSSITNATIGHSNNHETKASLSSYVTETFFDTKLVNSNTSNFEASSEDEGFWKVQMMQHSPRESLESEISQVSETTVDDCCESKVSLVHKQYQKIIKRLQKKSDQFQITIKHLTDKIHYLKQNPEKPDSEESCENSEYSKVVGLMEKCSIKHKEELNNYKTSIIELQTERDKLKQQLEELLEKQVYEPSPKHSSTFQTALEEMRKKYEQSLQNEKDFDKRNCTLLEENLALKNEISSLTAVLFQINKERSALHCISSIIDADITFMRQPNEIEIHAHELKQENSNVSDQQEANSLVEDNKYKAGIDKLVDEISELSDANAEIYRNLNERNVQISTLKEMIHLQNNKILSMETEKSDALNKLYETKSYNDDYAQENRNLKKKLLQLEKEIETLKSSHDWSRNQLESLNEEYLELKESHNTVCNQYKEMVSINTGLQKDNESLLLESNKFKDNIQQLESKLNSAENNAELNAEMILNNEENSRESMEIGDVYCQSQEASATSSSCSGDFRSEVILRSCINCTAFKNQIKKLKYDKRDLKGKIIKLEVEVGKRKNFERLVTQIDKLKQQNEELIISNDKFQNEIKENLYIYTLEKNTFINEKEALEVELSKLSHDEQKLKTMELEKEEILKTNAVLEDKIYMLQKYKQQLREVEEKLLNIDKDNKNIQNEKADLQEENLRDKARMKELEQSFANIQLAVKRHMKEKINAKKEKLNADAKLSKLQEDVFKLTEENKELQLSKNKIAATSINIKKKHAVNVREQVDRLEAIVAENLQLQQETKTLLSSKVDLKRTVKQLEVDLQKSEVANMSLEKQLIDLRSKYNCEKELNYQMFPPVMLQSEFTDCSKELLDTKIELTNSNNQLNILTEHLKVAQEHLSEKRQRLARSTLTLVNSCRPILEKDAVNPNVLKEFEKVELVHKKKSPYKELLDEELNKLELQVHLTTLLLDTLINLEITLKSSSTTTRQIRSQSLDGQIHSSRPRRNSCSESTTHNNSGNHYEDIFIESPNEVFDLQRFSNIPIVFPTITDTLLETLDLLHESDCTKLSEDELEKTFALMVVHFTVDIKSVQSRCRQQHEYQLNLEKSFHNVGIKLLNRLMQMKDMAKDTRLKQHLNAAYQYTELIQKLFSKTTTSAVQCGALKHEKSLLKCVNLMMNHSAHLSKKVDMVTQQLKTLSSSTTRKRNLFNKMSNNENIISHFVANKPDFDENNLTTLSTPFIPWLRTFSILVFVVIFILCCIIVEMYKNDNHSAFKYPWDWISWEEILSPFIKRSYLHGPPPT